MKQYCWISFFFIASISFGQISDYKHINFTKADNVASINKNKSLHNLVLLTHKLTNNLPTDVEKFRAIFKWVCNNIIADVKQHKTVSTKREKFKNDSLKYLKWNNLYKKVAFKKLLKHKKTMCTGYAYLIKEMAFLAGIESKIIDGYARTVTSNVTSLETVNHSWNAVKLNNKWYLCDATWASGYINLDNYFVKAYNDGYFLTDPALFSTNHFPINKKWLLNARTSTHNFITSPLLYNEAFKYKILPVNPSKMKIKATYKEVMDFEFKILKKISKNNVFLIYFSNNTEKKLDINVIKIENSTLRFKHKFSIKGNYEIHLKIGKDIVATYTVSVSSI